MSADVMNKMDEIAQAEEGSVAASAEKHDKRESNTEAECTCMYFSMLSNENDQGGTLFCQEL